MKKKFGYILLLLLFIGAASFVVLKYKSDSSNKQQVQYDLLDRKGPQANSEEWVVTKQATAKLMAAVKADPADKKSLIALANVMIIEARTTGNYTYYDMAAMKYVNDVLTIDPAHFEALMLKALIQLSQHHFSDGLASAEKARQINPYNAFVYGILVDANVEMGRYDSAVTAADQMLSIRPDLRSYARASYLREIHGDYAGAVEAMQMAIEAGIPGEEGTEWCRVQLGHLYEQMGDLKNAYMQYHFAINERPGYPWSLAGLARVAIAEKQYPKAVDYYLQADSIVANGTFKQELANAYRLAGNTAKANQIMQQAITEMTKNAAAALTDESIGHYSDKELAEITMSAGDYRAALNHALTEYNRRPQNIDVNETLAWAYFKNADLVNAAKHIDIALKTGSKNPVLLCRAGLIFQANGNTMRAKELLQLGLKNHPNIITNLGIEAATALQQL